MAKVKIVTNTPKKSVKVEKTGGEKPAPMAGDSMSKVQTRGCGAAKQGTKHLGC